MNYRKSIIRLYDGFLDKNLADIEKILRFLKDEILYNGHLQSLGAAGIVYISSALILNRNFDIGMFVVVYSTFQFIYLQDRYKDIVHDELSNLTRSKHLQKYLFRIPVLLLLLLSVIVSINVYSLNYFSLAFSTLVLFMGYLYTTNIKSLTRKIYLFKNVYVSTVFALLVIFPFIYYSEEISSWKLVIYFSALVLIESLYIQITLDIKDVLTDKKQKLLTLPLIVGKRKAVSILGEASLVTGALFVLIGTYFRFDSEVLILVIISLLINQSLIFLVRRHDFKGYVLTASKFFLWFLVIATIKMVI